MELDSLLGRWFPGLALARMKNRIRLEAATRVYDAAKQSNQRVSPKDTRSPDSVMEQAQDKIRRWARHLDENHDLSIGILDVLVNNIVGAGVGIEPMVMRKNGQPAEKVNDDLRKIGKMWAKEPEVTGEIHFSEVQRLACRTWLRDGETLIRHIRGGSFPHATVPYTMQLLEPDFLPFGEFTGERNVIHGVEKDRFGRPSAYHLFKQHPGNLSLSAIPIRSDDLQRVRADAMIHMKFTRRFGQTRGVPIFHGVIHRLDDIKDYEESERIAARIAASLTAFIQKGEDFGGENLASNGDRILEMQAGMIFDNLGPGESVGMIKSDRPNDKLAEFRAAQLRALAAGTGTNFSSIAKQYDGTYSAQRQELVESQPGYDRLRNYFIEIFMRPIWRELVEAAVFSGQISLNQQIDPDTIYDADMRSPGMPWIDPLKETQANVLAIENRLTSRTQVIRNHGEDPDVIREQIKQESEKDRADGLGALSGGDGASNGTGDGTGDGGDESTGADEGDEAAAQSGA
ncbi:MAG: phage portal protein [Methyloceanibacter sp.]|nr:phage portal protein [Methyloceanibacter sp.]